MLFKPELLAPAGNFYKLKVAVSYGADAVYLSGKKYGLRSASDNFTNYEIETGVKFAHARNVKVYVVLNAFLLDEDFAGVPAFIRFLASIEVDGVVVSDLGVFQIVQKYSNLKIHISTQASVLNCEGALFWKKMGAKRVILGREVSIESAAKIKKEVGIEVELFVHGSMCVAYSGNCVISNYTSGRDSNRGGCAHSCRFAYDLNLDKTNTTVRDSFFMSSKDLNGINLLPQMIKSEIDSFKIEGRMKSFLYLATTIKSYADAIEHFFTNGVKVTEGKYDNNFTKELFRIGHRDYCSGSLESKADESSIYKGRENSPFSHQIVGIVLESIVDKYMVLEVRGSFVEGEELSVIPFKGDIIKFIPAYITDLAGEKINKTRPSSLVKMPYLKGVVSNNILRKRVM